MWRRPAAHDALRGRTFTAYPEQEMVVAEGVGHTGGSAARAPSSHGLSRCRRVSPRSGHSHRCHLSALNVIFLRALLEYGHALLANIHGIMSIFVNHFL